MPRHYFFTSSASQPIRLDGREYKFIPLSILGGRVSGVFDSEDPTDIEILQRAVTRKIGITEISEAEAEKAKKRMSPSAQRSASLSPGASPQPRIAVSGAGSLLPMVEGAGSAASAKAATEASKAAGEITIPTILSMVRVGSVKPPQPFVAEGERMTIRGKK